jgi:hypothetical protein
MNLDVLRWELEKLPEIAPFSTYPELAERIATVGIAREVGTVNDELARFVFDADRGTVIDPKSLHSDFTEWNGRSGVRITSGESTRLELRARWTEDLLHPGLGLNPDGTLHSLFIFPGLIAEVAALEGVELVIVKSWAMNSIFGGFDPAKAYYQTNFWELENNDSFLFADLVRHGRLALLGTHDLIAHVAGVRRENWKILRIQANRVFEAIHAYFGESKTRTVASLVLPYTIGVVLDDLAQPPTYGSASHVLMLDALLEELARARIPPAIPTVLTRFPSGFEAIIETSRKTRSVEDPAALRRLATALVDETLSAMTRERLA